MEPKPTKTAGRRNLLLLMPAMIAMTGYWLYRDYQENAGWEESSVFADLGALCIGLLILGGVYWHTGRAARDSDEQESDMAGE